MANEIDGRRDATPGAEHTDAIALEPALPISDYSNTTSGPLPSGMVVSDGRGEGQHRVSEDFADNMEVDARDATTDARPMEQQSACISELNSMLTVDVEFTPTPNEIKIDVNTVPKLSEAPIARSIEQPKMLSLASPHPSSPPEPSRSVQISVSTPTGQKHLPSDGPTLPSTHSSAFTGSGENIISDATAEAAALLLNFGTVTESSATTGAEFHPMPGLADSKAPLEPPAYLHTPPDEPTEGSTGRASSSAQQPRRSSGPTVSDTGSEVPSKAPKAKRKRNAIAGPSRRLGQVNVSPERPPHWMGDDNNMIRCICGFSEDDGFTIQCEGCYAWEHGSCFGYTSPASAPATYFCELCMPRDVDVEAARRSQIRARDTFDVRDEGSKVEGHQVLDTAKRSRSKAKRQRTGSAEPEDNKDIKGSEMPPPALKHKRRNPHTRPRLKSTNEAPTPVEAPQPQQDDSSYFSSSPWELEFTPTKENVIRGARAQQAMAQVYREWVDAEENAQPPKRRAIHNDSGLPSPTETSALRLSPEALFAPPDFSVLAAPVPPVFLSGPNLNDLSSSTSIRSVNVSSCFLPPKYSEGASYNGAYSRPTLYGVFADDPISTGQFIGEYRGEVIDAESYRRDPINQYNCLGIPKPYVRPIGPPVNLLIDARGYGSELRFVRSGCHPNAVLRPLLHRVRDNDAPRLRFGIFAARNIGKREEIVLGWEWDDKHVVHTLRQIIDSTILPAGKTAPTVSPGTVQSVARKCESVLTHVFGIFAACACTAPNDCVLAQMCRLVQGKSFHGISGGRLRKQIELGELVGAVRGWRRRELEEAEAAKGWRDSLAEWPSWQATALDIEHDDDEDLGQDSDDNEQDDDVEDDELEGELGTMEVDQPENIEHGIMITDTPVNEHVHNAVPSFTEVTSQPIPPSSVLSSIGSSGDNEDEDGPELPSVSMTVDIEDEGEDEIGSGDESDATVLLSQLSDAGDSEGDDDDDDTDEDEDEDEDETVDDKESHLTNHGDDETESEPESTRHVRSLPIRRERRILSPSAAVSRGATRSSPDMSHELIAITSQPVPAHAVTQQSTSFQQTSAGRPTPIQIDAASSKSVSRRRITSQASSARSTSSRFSGEAESDDGEMGDNENGILTSPSHTKPVELPKIGTPLKDKGTPTFGAETDLPESKPQIDLGSPVASETTTAIKAEPDFGEITRGDMTPVVTLSSPIQESPSLPREPTPPPPEPPKKVSFSEYLRNHRIRKVSTPSGVQSTGSTDEHDDVPSVTTETTRDEVVKTELVNVPTPIASTSAVKIVEPPAAAPPQSTVVAGPLGLQARLNLFEHLPSSRVGPSTTGTPLASPFSPSGGAVNDSPRAVATPASNYVPRTDYFGALAAKPPSPAFVPRSSSFSYVPRTATSDSAELAANTTVNPFPLPSNAYVPRPADDSHGLGGVAGTGEATSLLPKSNVLPVQTPPTHNHPLPEIPPPISARDIPPHQLGAQPAPGGQVQHRLPPTGPRVPPTGPRGSWGSSISSTPGSGTGANTAPSSASLGTPLRGGYSNSGRGGGGFGPGRGGFGERGGFFRPRGGFSRGRGRGL